MLGINGGEFVILLLVALVVIGPERLPGYAEQLGAWVRTARRYALSAKERVSEELGEDVRDVDWAALDPRRYDPRRIVREALLDDTPTGGSPSAPSARPRASGSTAMGSTAMGSTAAGATATGAAARTAARTPSSAEHRVPAPFDDEAT